MGFSPLEMTPNLIVLVETGQMISQKWTPSVKAMFPMALVSLRPLTVSPIKQIKLGYYSIWNKSEIIIYPEAFSINQVLFGCRNAGSKTMGSSFPRTKLSSPRVTYLSSIAIYWDQIRPDRI